MNKELINRIKHWKVSDTKETEEDILNFETSNGIRIPKEYRELLLHFGKLSNPKTWYYFFGKDGVTDHQITNTLDLQDQEFAARYYWSEFIEHSSIIEDNTYLPVISTDSNNYYILIGLKDSNRGKIFIIDSNFEDKPSLAANSLYEFLTKKMFCTFSIHHESKKGTIEIQRKDDYEIWEITSCHFSIKNNSLNFWAESDHKTIRELDDTGDTLVACEVKIPLVNIPSFLNPWKFTYPDMNEISDKWGEESEFEYYDNFYYYSHDSFESQTIEIVKDLKDNYYVRISGVKDDPISSVYKKAKYIITAKLNIENTFKGYWCEE